MNSVFKENVKIAFASIRSNALRTAITAGIIAIGITALVGILTSIEVFKSTISENFAQMGSNTFTIQNRGPNIRIGQRGEKPKNHPLISINQAEAFKESFEFPALTSISFIGSGAVEVKSGTEETNPNIQVWGGDKEYLATAGYEISEGRNFSTTEIQESRPYAIIGSDLKKELFGEGNGLEQVISIRGQKFKVIGVLTEKGSALGFGGDKVVIIPLHTARKMFSRPNMSYSVSVMVPTPGMMESALGEATSAMRKVRGLKPTEEDNFNITKSDNIAQMVIGITSQAGGAVTIIGIITLLSSAISLMNIMLVSVTERTREIGIRKSIGATAGTIRKQFLIEAILITQIGGLGGVILGVSLGNLTALLMNGSFVIPYDWMALGLGLCFLVGILSGFIPANKASNLDPIESLRYE